MRRSSRHFSIAVVLAAMLALSGLVAAPAVAQQGTITAQACAQGRIHDQSGAPIPRARCDSLIGQPIELASTGFDAWILAAVGAACIGAALLLRRGVRAPAPR